MEAGPEFFGSQLAGPVVDFCAATPGPSSSNLTAQGQLGGSECFQSNLEMPTECLWSMCEGSLFVLFGILLWAEVFGSATCHSL